MIIDDGGNGLRCCSKDNKRPLPDELSYYGCLAMEVPKDDPFYAQFGGGCLDYIRSQPVFNNECQLGPAEIVCIIISVRIILICELGNKFNIIP